MSSLLERIERRVVSFQTPAAGAEMNLTALGLGTWRLLSLLFTFTASAVVAVRQLSLAIDDGTTTVWRGTTANTQAANSSNVYELLPQAIPTALINGLVLMAMPPEGLILPRGWRLRSTTLLIDVGDQYSAISAYVEELPDGPYDRYTPYQPTYDTPWDAP
ncbi:MAG TPA: hypothetical protein VFU23_10975 [Gemmatimonadales bacterium]|nr:hypothetical protein [Gemmatimonadales bacterium]